MQEAPCPLDPPHMNLLSCLDHIVGVGLCAVEVEAGEIGARIEVVAAHPSTTGVIAIFAAALKMDVGGETETTEIEPIGFMIWTHDARVVMIVTVEIESCFELNWKRERPTTKTHCPRQRSPSLRHLSRLLHHPLGRFPIAITYPVTAMPPLTNHLPRAPELSRSDPQVLLF